MPIVGNRNPEQEDEILEWIEAVLDTKMPKKPFEDVLKDGVVLCKLMNQISPGSVKKIQEKGSNFQLMENIDRFQKALRNYGVPSEELFQTPDLFERRNIKQVTLSLLALARCASNNPDYTGPTLGPKMATENKRNFSEEEIRRLRDAQIGLQAGAAAGDGASQAGHGGFGNTRHM